MSLAKETDGGRGTSFSVNTNWIPPANVMDLVGSGAGGDDTGMGSETVDDGSEIGIGAWGMNRSVGVAAAIFAAVFQNGM